MATISKSKGKGKGKGNAQGNAQGNGAPPAGGYVLGPVTPAFRPGTLRATTYWPIVLQFAGQPNGVALARKANPAVSASWVRTLHAQQCIVAAHLPPVQAAQ